MIPELLDHILNFLSPDSLLPPSLLELSKLLLRPTPDLVLLDDGSSHVCSYEGFVYSGLRWIVRVTRSELRQVRSPEYIGYRLTSLVPGVSTVITKVYSKLRGRACAWETSGLFRASLLVPISRVPAGLACVPRSYLAEDEEGSSQGPAPAAEARRLGEEHLEETLPL